MESLQLFLFASSTYFFAAQAFRRELAREEGKAKRPLMCVLTGGPCGGKSSLLRECKKKMEGLGVYVYTVPELPTILISGGASYPGGDNLSRLLVFEERMLCGQIAMEENFLAIAETYPDRPSLIICDRGACDISAYMPQWLWQKVLSVTGLSEERLLDRYDVVCHLVTAAEGAESFYTSANNEARTETIEEARELDKKTLQAWCGHQRRIVVDNATGISEKMNLASNFIADACRSHFSLN